MAFRDLLERPPAVALTHGIPLRERLVEALETPPMPNRYVAPRLRTLDAILFAVRGYDVRWTRPVVRVNTQDSSVLTYRVLGGLALELPTVVPGEVHRVASWMVGARLIGWRFAAWQAKRELSWIFQRNRK